MDEKIEFTKTDFEFAFDEVDDIKDEVMYEQSFLKDAWKRFKSNKGALISLFIIVLIIIVAIVAPMLSNYQYDAVDTASQSLKPSATHFFGTDVLGRDLWVRVWKGTRISLFIAFVAVVIDVVFGMMFGLISGYFGGKVDAVMQRFLEIVNSIPQLVVLTLLLMIMKASLTTIIIALMFTGWIAMSRITRAQVLKVKEQEYILASRTLGASHFFIIFKQILPNIFGQIIIMSMFSIPNAIFYEAFLAFIGLGLPVPEASLGTLINTGFKSILVSPYMVIIPVVVFAILMLSFNLLADGLKDAFDPKMKDM